MILTSKAPSKQCSDLEGKMGKSELSTLNSDVEFSDLSTGAVFSKVVVSDLSTGALLSKVAFSDLSTGAVFSSVVFVDLSAGAVFRGLPSRIC